MNRMVSPDTLLEGLIQITKSDDGFYMPVRFSKSQIQEYYKNSDFLLRAYASSGMCLHFSTDASAVDFPFRVSPGSAQDLYSFDVFVNGALFKHQQGKISDAKESIYLLQLPQGRKTVQIYLPTLAKTELGDVKLNDATFVEPVIHEKRLLVMGDSITQGYTGAFPSLSFSAYIARELNAQLLNQAIGGEFFHPEIVSEPCGWQPTHIIACYGTNEWALKEKQKFMDDAGAFFSNLHHCYGNIPTAVVTPIWRANKDTRREDHTFPFEEAHVLMGHAIEKFDNMVLIDGKLLMPEIPELMEDDVLHPNDLGNIVYGTRLLTCLPQSWKSKTNPVYAV